jgi:hypothetical protein
MHPQTVIVGFAFSGDLSMLNQYMPQFKFYKKIANLADLQTYYKTVYEGDEACLKAIGLGSVCKQLCGQEICKGERMSNWERRPLR